MFSMAYKVLSMLIQYLESFINFIMFHYFGVCIHGKPRHIRGVVIIRSNKKRSIQIGKDIEINSGKRYNLVGGDTKLILRTLEDGKIIIGKHVGISNTALVSKNNITIEDNVMIGGGCRIWDTDFHSLNYANRVQSNDESAHSEPIIIKQGAFIGGSSIILKGVIIGEKSIVGAGSVVTKDIPDGEIWAGNPAKFIKKIQ
ncbi:acyltransferase [Clostridium kluyveri]|uniref:acyltransferase n=1 Tax=Clostridium kluyveri TaxID=1534 RepID=UPI0022483AD0|nr:acyltransferase [Clostridium kluyveri]UZQ50358.1 acyltransferase [Clostridium kluyveri]